MNNFLIQGLICGLLLIGLGCNQPEMPEIPVVENSDIVLPNQVEDSAPPTATNTKAIVGRTFTLEAIETNGDGLKNWFRDLARANVAGKKTLVRIPVNRVFAFGCETPTSYCASTQTTGCYGPYLDLKGAIELINQANLTCELTCTGDVETEAGQCTAEFRDTQCSTLWDVEGYVTAASRVSGNPENDGGSCAEGELMYDFEVTRVVKKIDGGYDEEFKFIEYLSE